MIETLGTMLLLYGAGKVLWKHAYKAPILSLLALWFLMMCWEVYDLHADHVLAYSVILLGPVVFLVTRPMKVKERV